MRLVILDSYDKASEWAAKYVRNRILEFNPGPDRYFTLGLPTGSTPKGMYQVLIEFVKNGVLSFKYVKTFNMDEYVAFNEPGSSLVSRTRVKTLAQDTIIANSRFFGGDISKVPTMALTVGVGTVMDAREVMIIITGAHKSFALYKAIEEGISHMWTVSAFQQHPRTIFVCDEDATLELRVKTVKYFKGLMYVHNKLVEDSEDYQEVKRQKKK
ncbi:glucosamine-6-phosphate isomerase 1-like [Anneissia japonica]|uniref:glucosamine-6-phosphate isomerase 1-like n=1 Tax=Anneissia japonica TaxID=1529436 RepID=UPI001425A99B|nr:glucosamine-6-phosphate isomerase 1-like [Anneissia japonica]